MQRIRTANNFCPIDTVPYTNSKPTWLRPELVAEVKFSGWTQDMIMRTPIFLRFRYDKQPTECLIEQVRQEIDNRDENDVVVDNVIRKSKEEENRRIQQPVSPTATAGAKFFKYQQNLLAEYRNAKKGTD